MTAHRKAFDALIAGRALHPGQAARLLADLRRETGEELADAIEAQLDGQYRRAATDSDSAYRKKRVTYGTAMRLVAGLRALARASRPSFPHQRNNRSTS